MSKTDNPKWTIMVYLAGDNDLTSYCVSVLQQLEAVKYRKDICVLACFESSTPWPKGSRYLRINCRHRPVKKVVDWEIHNDLISPNGGGRVGSNFCDSKQNGKQTFSRPVAVEGLRRFIDWALNNHADSERFMLVLFGHGPIVAGQTFLLAENPASFLRMEDLKGVLDEHFGERLKRKLSILAFQNCVMNGVETAYEIRNHADYLIGSQGLVLATGWPYEKMIQAVIEKPSAPTKTIARKILKVCARNMLDFAIMDRSSDQSACDLRALRGSDTITPALRRLVKALIKALEFKVEKEKRVLVYPAIRDAVRLARLEAQTYWAEQFVDLFDFCERLIHRCNELVKTHTLLLKDLQIDKGSQQKLRDSGLLTTTREIVNCCVAVTKEIEELVPKTHTYYIGSELQYSHGLSIYFPWSLPAGPYFPRLTRNRKDYRLETAFDTYRQYAFVKRSDWDLFLDTFFRATLRNMRRGHRKFFMLRENVNLVKGLAGERNDRFTTNTLTADLQKSSPDTGRVNDDMWFSIKNYPRRNYLSPVDCPRKIVQASSVKPGSRRFEDPKSPPVSALGWNFSELVAEVIRKPKRPRKSKKQKTVQNRPLTKAASA